MSVIPDWAFREIDPTIRYPLWPSERAEGDEMMYPAVLIPCPPTGEVVDAATCAKRNKRAVNPNDTGSNTHRAITSEELSNRDSLGIEQIPILRRELELKLPEYERQFPGISISRTFSEWRTFIKGTGGDGNYFDKITSAAMLGLKENQKVSFVEFMSRVLTLTSGNSLAVLETEEKPDLTPILVLGGVILLFVVTQ